MQDQLAGVEYEGKVSMERQFVKKVSQSSCICMQNYHHHHIFVYLEVDKRNLYKVEVNKYGK